MWNPFKRDKVILKFYNAQHKLVTVKWFCGIPFAAPYLADTAYHLLPGGKLEGQSYIVGWFPATESMQEYYNKEKTHE